MRIAAEISFRSFFSTNGWKNLRKADGMADNGVIAEMTRIFEWLAYDQSASTKEVSLGVKEIILHVVSYRLKGIHVRIIKSVTE